MGLFNAVISQRLIQLALFKTEYRKIANQLCMRLWARNCAKQTILVMT